MEQAKTFKAMLAAFALGGVCVAQLAGAQPVVVETVTVGNPGNAGESQNDGVHGAVDYVYSIGKYEVTAGQYAAFLNAVAATDTYDLHHPRMDYDADPSREGCNIKQHGDPGSHTYTVAPDWADRPVNYVSWADAARFANWLHNGQPTGAQDLTTTEDGAYFLNGISEGNDTALEDVLREPDATWAIASEDEWYKAAYHMNDGATGNYWNNPTSANGVVSNVLVDPDPGHNATCRANQVDTIGAPYFRTEVGAHENSDSPYGTFDQGGNVMEFTEAVPESDIRRMRGGSWSQGCSQVSSGQIDDVMHSSDEFSDLGFRLVNLSGDPGGPVCGDEVCEGAETPLSCPTDCPDVCGDGLCSGDEDPLSCAVDCPDACGDGLCTGAEDPLTCSFDCPDVCGDGLCSGGEDPLGCAVDCPDACGDGLCTGSENPVTCSQDCADFCGDGLCSGDEDTTNCVADCGSACGDGVCNGSEDEVACPDDCASACIPDGGGLGCDAATPCCSGVGNCTGGKPSNRVCALTSSNCGDGIVEGAEECEAGVPLADTCTSLGFDGGSLACNTSTCVYDTSGCTGGSCLPAQAACADSTDCCSGNCKRGECKGN